MNTPSSPQPDQVPTCPRCNAPLVRKGKIGDAGFVKKWIEYWHCRTHGDVDPNDSGSKKKAKA